MTNTSESAIARPFALGDAATLTADLLNAMSSSAFASMSASQVKALSDAALAGLSTTQASHLSPAEAAALTRSQVAALTRRVIAHLPTADIAALKAAGLSANQIGALSSAQIRALSAAQLNGLTTAALDALNVASLTTTQVAALSTSAIARLSPAQVAHLSLADLAAMLGAQVGALTANAFGALTTSALQGITFADIDALSTTQIAAFTSAQAAALSAGAAAALARLQNNGATNAVTADFRSQVVQGAIGYSGLLKVLEDAATGGMTSAKFAALTQIADELNATGGVATSAADAQLFSDVVRGDSANATWTGGAASPVALGDLSALSSQTQTSELIGKWFLGTDLPSFQAEAGSDASGYKAYSLPLFSTAGPQYTDINQGVDGDCYFMSAMATQAQQDPALIRNMFQSEGGGVYSVEFQVNGKADYVTVNSQLVALAPNKYFPSGGTQIFANNASDIWAPLMEKAYAQLMSQSGVATYAGVGNIDSYSAIDGGDSNGLQAITGQQVVEDYVGASTSTSNVQSDLVALQSAFANHEGAMLATSDNSRTPNSNWVGDHMFTVMGVNATAGIVDLFNPWGTAAAHPGFATQFTASIADMKAMGVTLEYAVGTPAAA